jgi:hypothetical protein
MTAARSVAGPLAVGQTFCHPAGMAVGVGVVEGGSIGVAEAVAALEDGVEMPTDGAGDARVLGVGDADVHPPSRMMARADGRTDRRMG